MININIFYFYYLLFIDFGCFKIIFYILVVDKRLGESI